MTIDPKELEARVIDLLRDKLSMDAFDDTPKANKSSETISPGQFSAKNSDIYFSAIAKLCVENMTLRDKLDTALPPAKARTDQPLDSMTVELPTKTESLKPDKFETFHQVHCDENRRNYYRDVPRMFQGDLISDHLRGQHGLPKNLTKYLEENLEILFALIKTYDCGCCGGSDDRGTVGYRDGKLLADSPPAESTSVRVVLGDRMEDIIKGIINSHAERFKGYSAANIPDWSPEPYRFFFNHNKTLLDIAASSDVTESDRSCIQMLCNWFETNHRKDWDEAHELMSRGKINPKHYTKLFGPDELYVRPRYDDDPDVLEVLKSKDFPWVDSSDEFMDGYAWEFNGHFRKIPYTYSLRRFPRPSVSIETEVDITSLPVYPLRFAEPGTKEKLIARGHKFWNCRTRSLVCYRESGEALMLAQVRDIPQYRNEKTR